QYVNLYQERTTAKEPDVPTSGPREQWKTRHAHKGKEEADDNTARLCNDGDPQGRPGRTEKNTREEKLPDDVPAKHGEPPYLAWWMSGGHSPGYTSFSGYY